MMRRGPLAGNPIESLLAAAAEERANGVIELHSVEEGRVYLVEGEVYFADFDGQPPLGELLEGAGLLTRAQIERHTEPGDDGPYLALALDTDETIDEHAIGAWLFDRSAATLGRFLDVDEGEYELDPYASHPAGILASWTHGEVLARARELRAEAEQRAEAERLEAERLEAERAAELERREAEQRADAERARLAAESSGDADAAAPSGEGPSPDDATPPPPAGDTDEPGRAPPPPPPPAEPPRAPRADEPQVLIVTADAAPDGLDRIELSPLEWRVVVLAARGMSLTDLARRLDLDRDEVAGVVSGLSDRGLLATVG